MLLHPSNPNIVVARWALASEGFLFSHDGGETFAGLCSDAVTAEATKLDPAFPVVRRISAARLNSNAATLLDGDGRLYFTQLDGLWADDATGCAWGQDPAFDGLWPTAVRLDPVSGELLAIVNRQQGSGSELTARSHLMRRDAGGTWTSFDTSGALVGGLVANGVQIYGSELMVSATAAGSRYYALVTRYEPPTSPNPGSFKEEMFVVRSDDGGRSWSQGAPLPPEQAGTFSLLAIDPTEPRRLLAVLSADNAADTLLVSEDEGNTFAPYAEVREASGVDFGPNGTLFVSDSGDASTGEDAIGGLWTAARMGQPLTRIEGTGAHDCVTYSSRLSKLYLCRGNKLRLFDPSTRTYDLDVVSLDGIEVQLSCPNIDVPKVCEKQLNAGAAWCCTGHYPCTPFCSMYDVTEQNGQRVFCGRTGLAYDLMAGRSCDMDGTADAGAPDAGRISRPPAGTLDSSAGANPTDASLASAPDSGRGRVAKGCALESAHPEVSSLGLMLLVLFLRPRNNSRSRRRSTEVAQ